MNGPKVNKGAIHVSLLLITVCKGEATGCFQTN